MCLCVYAAGDNSSTEGGTSPVCRSGSADRLAGGVSQSRSNSPLRPTDTTTSTGAGAAADGVLSSSVDVDPVSVQMALRNFAKQLITAEKDRVSNIY